jgi:ATP-binding protein involved in chromosome partitioning
VCSGKGGVGKSTIAANLAVALAQTGKQVGILDADVYGHSIPHVLGIRQKPVLVDKMIVPPVKHELKLMSIGFFLDDNQPVMWRGPMLHRALEQFLSDVHWGDSTCSSSTCRRAPATSRSRSASCCRAPRRRGHDAAAAAQEVASARRDGAEDRHALIGVVENMTARCSARAAASGWRGARRAAARRVPLDPLLRECGDAGEPLMVAAPDSSSARAASRDRRRDRALERGSIVKPCPSSPDGRSARPAERARLRREDAEPSQTTSSTPSGAGKRGHGMTRVDWLETLTG